MCPPNSKDSYRIVNSFEESLENDLAPWRAGPFIVGAVYEVNGEGAVEHTTQVSTFEIELLCKHWAGRRFNIHYMWEVCGQSGSREIREGPYAEARLVHFAQILGWERVDAIIEEFFRDVDFAKAKEEYEAWCAEQEASLRDGPSPEECGEDLAVPPNDERASLERRSGATSEYRIEGTKAIPSKKGGNDDDLRF